MYRSFKRHDLVGGVTTVKGEEADYLEFSFSAVAGCNFAADSADSRCVHCARIKWPGGKKKPLHLKILELPLQNDQIIVYNFFF